MKSKNLSPRTPREPLNIKLDYFALQLDLLNEKIKANGSRVYEEQFGVSLRDLRLMRFIGAEPGLTLGRLIEHTALEKTLASKAVTTLADKGLVTRSVGLQDARQISLELTDAGEEIVRAAEPVGRFMEALLLQQLTERDQDVLRRCLRKISASAEETGVRVDEHIKSLRSAKSSKVAK